MDVIMKLIRWILGRIIIFLDMLFSPKAIIRELSQQKQMDEITSSYKLYQYNACPFCVKVRRFLKKQSLTIDLIDAKQESHKRDLVKNGGKQKVPCLKVKLQNKENKWIYESDDIIKFLSKKIKTI